ncbi:MAG: hypothetical protein KAR62_00650 [Sphingomonadales bacterium]|nr:hypothetical protein [Sphingomonadales bacterium]
MASLGSIFGGKGKSPVQEATLERPRLELSGPTLTSAFETLTTISEEHGGIEKYVDALKLKSELFKEVFEKGADTPLEPAIMKGISLVMPTVRRRIGIYLDDGEKFEVLRSAISGLLDGMDNTRTTDARMAAFCACFPEDKAHRWVKDLGSEILHNTDLERYPQMNRWMWDKTSNTGMLREIWYDDNIDHITLDIPDGYGTFIMLREEIAQFLSGNGIYKDMFYYIDLLFAQVYSDYITAQGGTYLRADFSTPDDPMEHTRRLLGLDVVRYKNHPNAEDADEEQTVTLIDTKLLMS